MFKFYCCKKKKKKACRHVIGLLMHTSMKIVQKLHLHFTQLQPLLRHNALQIGCRQQSRRHCNLNKLHKCPASCLPPHFHDFIDAQMLKLFGFNGFLLIMLVLTKSGPRHELHSFIVKVLGKKKVDSWESEAGKWIKYRRSWSLTEEHTGKQVTKAI